jgi:PTH2 family peptidyl-tRNA hydrolase
MPAPSPAATPFLLGCAVGAALGYAAAVAAAPHGGLFRVAMRRAASLAPGGAGDASSPPPRKAATTLDAAPVPSPSPAASSSLPKMVIVVRRDLDMGRGKTAAQAAHAAVGLYKKCRRGGDDLRATLRAWEVDAAGAKVVLRVDSEAELRSVEAAAAAAGLPVKTIADAGRTQVAPGSTTCLAVLGGGGAVDAVTGGLKLL